MVQYMMYQQSIKNNKLLIHNLTQLMDKLALHYSSCSIPGNFCENGDFNNFAKIFSQMIHVGNIKGVAWQYFHKI